MTTKNMFALAARLALFVAAVVVMLSLVNYLTRDTIAERKRLAGEAARAELMAECEFRQLTDVVIPENSEVTAVYRAEKDGTVIGYCFDVSVKGYNEISMIVGVNADLSVAGVKILSQSETPGIGSKAVDEQGAYLPLFRTQNLESVKSNFVSGATISSKGIWNGVSAAVDFCAELTGKGD